MRRRLSLLLPAFALVLAMASPAWAITFGQVDTANTFANVGALIGMEEVPVLDENGEPVLDENGDPVTEVLPFIFCSGTLIEDGDDTPATSNLFLTAAHCIPPEEEDSPPGEPMQVTFDKDVDLGDPPFQPVILENSVIYSGTAFAHPNAFCCGLNEPFDVAVVVLDQEVADITPAQIAAPNQLGEMTKTELRSATFLTAGYGTVRNDKTKAFASFSFDGDRRWATQTFKDLLKAWLDLSMQPSTGDGGTCYGDSGGPHFLDGVVVSLTVTGDIPCRATDKTYRIDTAVPQEFIGQFLGS